jgi:hypothetical protein
MATVEQSDSTVPPEYGRRLCQIVAEDCIRSGLVDPKGKTDEEFQMEILACLQDIITPATKKIKPGEVTEPV